jgi:hypothetical protein
MTSIIDQPREASHCKTASVAVLSAPANAVETLMANTTNPGTRLIEEGALLPESVRSESEPWTSFYMVGEIIRELQMALANKQVNVPATKNDMRKAA